MTPSITFMTPLLKHILLYPIIYIYPTIITFMTPSGHWPWLPRVPGLGDGAFPRPVPLFATGRGVDALCPWIDYIYIFNI